MKKILFPICVALMCAMLLPATLLIAQPSSVYGGKDSLRVLRHADSVVQNAPFIFRGREIAQKTVRSANDHVIAVYQFQVIDVLKGQISIGDTVEVSYSIGWAFWYENGNFRLPRHSQPIDVYWGDPTVPVYYFGKFTENKPYFENSKQSFVLFSESPFSVCTYENGLFFSNLHFNKDYQFFNYINKLLTPKVEVKPKPVEGKKGKSKKKQGQKIGNATGEVQYMPAKTFNIRVSDTVTNLSTYNSTNDGWYPFNITITGANNETSFLRSYQFDLTYDNLYFPQNIANDITKLQVTRSNSGFSSCTGNIPAYTETVTNIAPNKIRIKLKLTPNFCGSPARFGFGVNASTIQYGIKIKAVNSAITCMPSVGTLSGVSAVYDNVTTTNAPATNDTTNYLIQSLNTRFRMASPTIVPCVQLIDSISFTPRTIRAGTNEVLTIKAYGKNPNGAAVVVPWFGASRGSLGNVQFRDANKTTGYVNKIDNSDVVWGASELKVKIPSLYLDDANSLEGCAASGLFFIKTSTGDTATSKKRLHIEYAAMNCKDRAGLKKRAYLANQSCRNKYPLRCHNNLSYTYRQCVWAAAKHWNAKLGYEVFQIARMQDTTPISNYDIQYCIVSKDTPVAIPPPNRIILQETLYKNTLDTQTVVGGKAVVANTGFNIRMHPSPFNNNQYQTDIPQLLPNGSYVYANTINNVYTFYEAILHELGHAIGIEHAIDENHNDAATNLDQELMYWDAQATATTAVNRRSLSTGNAHSLKGAQRIFTDSKNLNWTSSDYGTFADSLPVIGLTQAGSPANRKICGYGNIGKLTARFTTNIPNNKLPLYKWEYETPNYWTDADVSHTLTKQDSNLILKNNSPTMLGYLNLNNKVFRCTAFMTGCRVTSDTVIFKASGSVVLKTPPSRCIDQAANWIIPTLNPTNGVFTAYNTSNNLLRTDIDTIIGSTKYFKKWKFATPSTYKIIYTVPLASYCPANTIITDSTWFSTFADCTTLGANNQKLYINEVYKDLTAFRNGGTNDPCNTMKVNFTALGNFVIGDTLKIKISDINGKVNTQTANIRKRIVGQYIFTASATNKTDSVKIENMTAFVDTTSANYKVQIFLKKKGVNTLPEWGDKNIENLYFFRNKACPSVGGGGVCCQGTGRTAPNNFIEGEIQLYPNPTTDRFTLQTPEYDAATEVSISDIQGRLIDKQTIFGVSNEIETHELPNGVYYVHIAQGERSTILKLVVMK